MYLLVNPFDMTSLVFDTFLSHVTRCSSYSCTFPAPDLEPVISQVGPFKKIFYYRKLQEYTEIEGSV